MYHIIINPVSCSGRGKKYWKRMEDYLINNKIPYQAHISQKRGQVVEIMRNLSRTLDRNSKSIFVIIVGGDGTLNESIQGICNFEKVILSYIPTGSGNDFARDFRMSKDPVENLIHIIHSSSEKLIDIAKASYDIGSNKIESRYFIVSCGFGYDAAVCEASLHSKAKKILNRIHLGKLIYLLHALRLLASAEPNKCNLTIEDTKETISFYDMLFIAGMNHKYEGGGFMFAPNALNNDGYIDICLVDHVSKGKVLRVLPKAFKGKHIHYKGVYSYQTKCYSIQAESPLWLQTDGEILAMTKTLTVSCIPRILHFYY